MAVKINDYIAEQIKGYPNRFGAFALVLPPLVEREHS